MRLLIMCVLSVLLLFGFPCVMSEVGESFSKCREFFFNKMPPRISSILKDSGKMICQKYKSRYRYATFYSTTNRIPVFSAYTYTGMRSRTSRYKKSKISWMIEHQLEPLGTQMHVPFDKQAKAEDYHIGVGLSASPLFSSDHAADSKTAESTFTLTNAVPQKTSFKDGSWNRMITKTKEIMKKCCQKNPNKVLAYVLTGAVPGNTQLNERVNIPSYMWMAFCCYNSTSRSWISQAYWALNEKEDSEKDIPQITLEKLQKHFNDRWVKDIQLFHNNCKKN